MENYLALAEKYIREKAGNEFAIVPNSVLDLDDFFCFTYQTKKYLETNDFSHMAVGHGIQFISKKDKRHFGYGSRHNFEEAYAKLKNKIKIEEFIIDYFPEFNVQKKYDLEIISGSNLEQLIPILSKYASYVIPEVSGESIYRINKKYTEKLAKEKLKQLPFRFKMIHQNYLLFESLIKTNCCKFKIHEHETKQYIVYLNKARDIDFEAVW